MVALLDVPRDLLDATVCHLTLSYFEYATEAEVLSGKPVCSEQVLQVFSAASCNSAFMKTMLTMSDTYNLENKQLLQLTGREK